MWKCANVEMWKCGIWKFVNVEMWKRDFFNLHIFTFPHFSHLHIAKEKGFAFSEAFFFGLTFPTPASPTY